MFITQIELDIGLELDIAADVSNMSEEELHIATTAVVAPPQDAKTPATSAAEKPKAARKPRSDAQKKPTDAPKKPTDAPKKPAAETKKPVEQKDEEDAARKWKLAALTAVMAMPCDKSKSGASSGEETVVAKSPKRKQVATSSAREDHAKLLEKKVAIEEDVARIMSKYTKVLMAVAEAEAAATREAAMAAAAAARKKTIDAKKAAPQPSANDEAESD